MWDDLRFATGEPRLASSSALIIPSVRFKGLVPPSRPNMLFLVLGSGQRIVVRHVSPWWRCGEKEGTI